ncbi:MAG: ABC transporter ATP-binding protein [Acidimicrobiales bacterium]
MTALRLNGVSKTYGSASNTVVDDIDLEVADGEFVVLLGPSGCGKTTTLRMIAGLEKPTAGELWFGDRLVNDVPPDQRNVGMVFQNYALYPHMTVYDNLSFGLRSRSVSKTETNRRVNAMAETLELQELMRRRPKQLSGGQRQRVALGRALVREPAVFLLDEPLSNLDANLREQIRLDLARLHARLGITTIYVTHDQGEALTLADRVVVMDAGRIRQIGPPGSIYSAPNDTFVARFIGSPGMNLWELPWADQGDRVSCGSSLSLPRSVLPQLSSVRDRVTIGLRPEHLALAMTEPAADQVSVVCRVELVEHLGSHLQLHGHLRGTEASELSIVARMEPGPSLKRGEDVRLVAAANRLRLFDAKSGRCLDRALQAQTSAEAPSAGAQATPAPELQGAMR